MDSQPVDPMQEQANKIKAAQQAEATALGKIIQMVGDKLKEHLCDEIEYYCFRSDPVTMDKSGSDVPKRTWKANGTIKADFVNKNSDNLNTMPLQKYFDSLEAEVNNSRDMVTIQMKIRQGSIDDVEDEIYERFFTQEYQIQTLKTEEWHYIGTVNKYGKPEGIGRMVFANNAIYEGAFKNGEAAGYGRRFEPQGSVYNGLYFRGIRQGRGILINR